MLYLIRHAKTLVKPERPAAEWDLDPAGLPALSAMATARDWNAIPHWYSSAEPKALKTAAVLPRRPVVQREGLAEVRGGRL